MLEEWLTPFQSPWDTVGFILFLLVFPIYHGIYPWIASLHPTQTARGRVDILRTSWIERLIARDELIAAAQQTRNLTMVNSVLVSSSLILLGITANLLLQFPAFESRVPHPLGWESNPGAIRVKLYLLILAFASAFSFCMTALRHLGHFVLVIGADPKLIAEQFGNAPEYLADLINRASHRHTLGVRSFYAAFPLMAWLFDTRLFLLLTFFWGLKFVGFQDFSVRRTKR